MPTRDNFLQIIRKWDAETLLGKSENNKPQSIPIRGPYLEQWETIETLAKIKYTPYLNDDIQDFFGKLWSWLEQFDSDDEKRLAFKIASRITFITEEQIRYLQEVCFKEKLLYRILQKSISENKLAPYAYNEAQLGYDAELKKCLIVPLTDSARYNQFVHVNGLENHSQLGVSTLDIFVHPD